MEQWQVSRDLYVILSGAVEVVADGNALATLGPGEFFGELAAIEWGAGFARTRAATVTATEPTRLLVLDWELVNWLMKAEPVLRRATRAGLARAPCHPLSRACVHELARGLSRVAFLLRPTRGFWVGIAFLGVVAVMALVVPAEPLDVDQRWSEAMLDSRTSFLTDLALVFNWLGRGLGCVLSLAAVGIVLLVRRRWLALLAFGVTEAVTTLSSTLLKLLVGRARPPDGLVHPVGSSFPSGHAAYAGATCSRSSCCSPHQGHPALGVDARGAGLLGMAWSRPISRSTGYRTSSADRCSASAARSPSSPARS